MPLQNRVTPAGDIVVAPERGSMMGNRGIIHDHRTRRLLTRRWQHQAWICCVLSFKDYQHPIMGKGRYTELFFLDEASALAAGHRPCALCRRGAYDAFRAAWAEGNDLGATPEAARTPLIDRRLHGERVTRRREKVTFEAVLGGLPPGVFVLHAERAHLWLDRSLHPWSMAGYGAPVAGAPARRVAVLTPASIVKALAAGYTPGVWLNR